jgi:hypothetical protein
MEPQELLPKILKQIVQFHWGGGRKPDVHKRMLHFQNDTENKYGIIKNFTPASVHRETLTGLFQMTCVLLTVCHS